jgi:hypothetical protein
MNNLKIQIMNCGLEWKNSTGNSLNQLQLGLLFFFLLVPQITQISAYVERDRFQMIPIRILIDIEICQFSIHLLQEDMLSKECKILLGQGQIYVYPFGSFVCFVEIISWQTGCRFITLANNRHMY